MPPVAPAKSLAVTHPDIASQLLLIYKKDKSISNKNAEDVTAGSGLRGEFSCPAPNSGHSSYSARIIEKTRKQPVRCPTCSGHRVETGINDLATTHPEISSQILYIYEKEGTTISNLTTQQVNASSGLKAEFSCLKKESNHSSYKVKINIQTGKKPKDCSTCTGRRVETGINDLATTHPEIASEILHIYENDGITISNRTIHDVSAGSEYKAEFHCVIENSGHSPYSTIIYNRTKKKPTGCPTCANHRVEAGINDLATTHPEIASEILHIYENDGITISNRTIHDVSAGSEYKAEFHCVIENSGHSPYSTIIYNRTSKNPTGCPTCAGKRVETGINDLATTHPEIASEILHIYENDGITISNKTSQEVSMGCALYAVFSCPINNSIHPSYPTRISNRTKMNPNGCPLCATSKTENLFRASFTTHTSSVFLSSRIPLVRELFVSGMAQIDMLCEELGLVIEYDGAWAHGGVDNPNKERTLEDCLTLDTDSTLALIKAGYKVIRIRECDRKEKLPFLELAEEYASNLYQVNYKSFGKDKHDIDELVKSIIKEKEDWFLPALGNKSAPLSALQSFC